MISGHSSLHYCIGKRHCLGLSPWFPASLQDAAQKRCSPATLGLAVFQLSGKQLGDVGEAVAHSEDVPAVRAQDGGEGICDTLNFQ